MPVPESPILGGFSTGVLDRRRSELTAQILCILGWRVNHKRVYRIWRQGGLRIPQKRGKKKHDSGNGLCACDRRPPEYMNHIWSYDIMEDRLENGREVRILNVIDDCTREVVRLLCGNPRWNPLI